VAVARDPPILVDTGLDALLIDWGGVLTTSMMGSFDAFSAREVLPEHAVRHAFRDDPAARTALIELECGRIDIPTFEARLASTLGVAAENLAKRLTAGVEPDHELRAAVRAFHDDGIRTALVSNSWRKEDYDVADLFDVVVLSGDLGIRKPDPEIYAVAVERLGVTPERCVFVDDLGGNLKPAKALGMTTIRHVETSDTIARLKHLLKFERPS
jgi:epoxide hydrolase-like predicted phosphatase